MNMHHLITRIWDPWDGLNRVIGCRAARVASGRDLLLTSPGRIRVFATAVASSHKRTEFSLPSPTRNPHVERVLEALPVRPRRGPHPVSHRVFLVSASSHAFIRLAEDQFIWKTLEEHIPGFHKDMLELGGQRKLRRAACSEVRVLPSLLCPPVF